MFPREKNVKRPVASEPRCRLTMAKADEADPSGRLVCILAIARYTGRRVNAICHLRASDVLLAPDAMTRALAEHGQDPGLIQFMPHAPLRWRAEQVPHLDRGALHPCRRLWAVERKHLPDVDVARGGGWRDLATMKLSYQQPDPATTLRAIETSRTQGARTHFGHTPEGKRR